MFSKRAQRTLLLLIKALSERGTSKWKLGGGVMAIHWRPILIIRNAVVKLHLL